MSNLILPPNYYSDNEELDMEFEAKAPAYKRIQEKQKRLVKLNEFLKGFTPETEPSNFNQEAVDGVIEEIRILNEDIKRLREEK